MAIGDVEVDGDGYGTEEIACPECIGFTGVVDPDCICCDGDGHCFKLIAPEDEIAAAMRNVFSQIPGLNTKH